MLELDKSYTNHKNIFDELLVGSGVVVFKEVFFVDQINEARKIVNQFS